MLANHVCSSVQVVLLDQWGGWDVYGNSPSAVLFQGHFYISWLVKGDQCQAAELLSLFRSLCCVTKWFINSDSCCLYLWAMRSEQPLALPFPSGLQPPRFLHIQELVLTGIKDPKDEDPICAG